MDTKFSFFILLLTLSSYNQLFYSPFLVEARSLSSNEQTYTIDLIHRDSPSFSSYNPSTTTNDNKKRQILGSISYNHHFHLSSKHYGNTTTGTEVIPNGGDYLVKIAIGTPPVELTAVADTGSDLVWVQCTPCQECISQEEPLFNPRKSSSYKPMPCNSHSCNYTDLHSICLPNDKNDHDLCVYRAEYADGTGSIGVLAIDKVTFRSSHAHSSVTIPSINFGCGFNQEGNFGTNGDGIIGLGTGNLSLVSQLGSTISRKFTYCLTPLSSGVNGKLKLGANKKKPGSVSTPMVNFHNSGFYTLRLEGVTIGKSSIKAGEDVIIDSGSTFTFLKSSVYDSLKNTLKKAIKLKPVSDPDVALDLCYEEEETKKGFNPPDVVFHFKGADIVLKSINIFRTSYNRTCLAIVPADDIFVLGNIAQVNFEVEYDLEARQVSFAPTDCTKY